MAFVEAEAESETETEFHNNAISMPTMLISMAETKQFQANNKQVQIMWSHAI